MYIGTRHVVCRKHMNKLKDGCILANMGHSSHEIDVQSLKDLKKERIRPRVAHYIWPNDKRIVLLAEVHACIYILMKFIYNTYITYILILLLSLDSYYNFVY